jgi:hypothetical protein
MSIHEQVTATGRSFGLSLDGWAVAIALFLTALIRLGVLKRIPW